MARRSPGRTKNTSGFASPVAVARRRALPACSTAGWWERRGRRSNNRFGAPCPCAGRDGHAGEREQARALARRNIDAIAGGSFDAIIPNAASCGSTLKEYHDLSEDDSE